MPLLSRAKNQIIKKGSRINSLVMQKSVQKQLSKSVFSRKGALNCTRRSVKAVFTVEAALVLPIVLFILMAVCFFFQILSIESAVQTGLTVAARQTAIYTRSVACLECEEEQEQELLLLGYAGKTARETIKTMECPVKFIEGKVSGIRFHESQFEGENVSLIASYKIELPISIFGRRSFRVKQKSISRKWTGASPRGEQSEQEEWVYITDTGTAYHKSKECTYLSLTIQSVSSSSVDGLRNAGGARYKPCESCAKGSTPSVSYITKYGTRYHFSMACSGLKRTIYYRRLSELNGYTPCHKCYPK